MVRRPSIHDFSTHFFGQSSPRFYYGSVGHRMVGSTAPAPFGEGSEYVPPDDCRCKVCVKKRKEAAEAAASASESSSDKDSNCDREPSPRLPTSTVEEQNKEESQTWSDGSCAGVLLRAAEDGSQEHPPHDGDNQHNLPFWLRVGRKSCAGSWLARTSLGANQEAAQDLRAGSWLARTSSGIRARWPLPATVEEQNESQTLEDGSQGVLLSAAEDGGQENPPR